MVLCQLVRRVFVALLGMKAQPSCEGGWAKKAAGLIHLSQRVVSRVRLREDVLVFSSAIAVTGGRQEQWSLRVRFPCLGR